MKKNTPKIAIVHDWLTDFGGAENVVLAFHKAFPKAPIFTSVFEPKKFGGAFDDADIRTTFLQKFPQALRRLHKFFPVLRVWAFRKLDLSEFDIILSSSSAESKQVRKTRKNQIHICYCHTPIRYYWSHYERYLADPGFGKLNFLVKIILPFLVKDMRKKDFAAAQQVDFFIANSHEVSERIATFYHKKSDVIHPPVSLEKFHADEKNRQDFYVMLGRQVPYKKIDLGIQACTNLNKKLKVFGSGSEHEHLKQLAGSTVEFFTDRFGDASDEQVAEALANARGYIFPAEEDFGIVQVEALASGAPVLGLARGGTLDIVDSSTGVLFKEQTVSAVEQAILQREKITFDTKRLRAKAALFDEKIFIRKITTLVKKKYNDTL